MSTPSTTELDQTISALDGGLTSVPPITALKLIDSFRQQVQDLGADEIASNLSALKELLTSGSATGDEIGQVLAQLGSQTTSAAKSANADISHKLQQLGQLLTEEGNSLLAARQKNESSQSRLASDI